MGKRYTNVNEVSEPLPRILIVDDEHQLRALLSRSFVRAGYEVVAAPSALDALAFCSVQAFDAVLSDVDMPKMNGHELARWFAVNHPKTLCVLMSGFGTECEECPFAGRCILLRKPFAPQAAVSLLTRMLSQRPVDGVDKRAAIEDD